MKHFITLEEVSGQNILDLIEKAKFLKANRKSHGPLLEGKVLGLIFAKSSTRTRVSFEVGIMELGGNPVFLSTNDIQLGRGETIEDTAKTLSRYLDAIMIRTFNHEDVQKLAQHSSIPIINGLTDYSHPCQIMADLLTIDEVKGGLKGIKLAYIGDGNNVAHSLLFGCAKVGASISVACPAGYECDKEVVKKAETIAAENGCKVVATEDPFVAVADADVVYTDTWISMGQEAEKAARVESLKPYQVNKKLFSAAKDDAMFLHCLPAYRGFEVTEDIIDGDRSYVFQEAENRLHAQKAVMLELMG